MRRFLGLAVPPPAAARLDPVEAGRSSPAPPRTASYAEPLPGNAAEPSESSLLFGLGFLTALCEFLLPALVLVNLVLFVLLWRRGEPWNALVLLLLTLAVPSAVYVVAAVLAG